MSQPNLSKKFKVYTASAGSGKTFRLTLEYLKIALRNPKTSFRSILAITFTVKATNEMKQRILEACEAFSKKKTVPLTGRNLSLFETLQNEVEWTEEEIIEKSSELFKTILHNYGDFAVSTIDSFSQRLIRAFAFELNLPVNFEVVIDNSQIIDLLVAELLNKVGGENKELTTLVSNFYQEKLIEKDSTNFLPSLIQSAEVMLKEESQPFLNRLLEVEPKELLNISKEFSKLQYSLTAKILSIAKEADKAIFDAGLDYANFSGGANRGKANFFKYCLEKKSNSPSATFRTACETGTGWFKKDDKLTDDALQKKLSELGTQLLEVYDQNQLIKALRQNFPQMSLIAELKRIYLDYQMAEQVLLIQEFNPIIHSSVKGEPAPFIFEKVGEQYNHVLIDEFQDTSIVQWHNLAPLVAETLSKTEEGNESLIVGDSKQAIYRFRGGETKQLTELPNLIGQDEQVALQDYAGIFQRYIQKEDMPFNFRSKEEIVNFNNLFYQFIAEHPELSEFEPIYKTYFQTPFQEGSGGFIKIKQFPKPDKEGEEEYSDLIFEELLATIQDIEARNLPLNEVAILTRNNKELQKTGEFLVQNGYQITSKESLALNNHTAVKTFISLLGLVYTPNNSILQAEFANGLKRLGLLDISLAEMNESIGLKQANSFEEFIELIEQWNSHLQFNQLPKTDLLGMYERFISYVTPTHQSSSFVSFFRDVLWKFIRENGNDVEGFLDFWEQKGDKLYVNTMENEDAIQLLTIHKAKGLEYEVVILPFANWEIKRNENKWVRVSDTVHDVFSHYYVSISKTLENTSLEPILLEIKSKSLLDNLNLLYVATTRPISELYIFSQEQSKKVQSKSILESSTISQVIYHFLTSVNANEVELGNPVQFQTKEEASMPILLADTAVAFGKAEIAVKNKSKVIWSKRIREAIDYGEVVHQLLERVSTIQDIELVAASAIAEGLIIEAQKEEVVTLINRVVTHNQLKKYFTTQQSILAEQSILTEDGKEYIPDRIAIHNKEVQLLDFKTGLQESKHIQQINHYADLLRRMGYSVTEQLLVYLSPFEVKTVES